MKKKTRYRSEKQEIKKKDKTKKKEIKVTNKSEN
jgi:hypothetical protein